VLTVKVNPVPTNNIAVGSSLKVTKNGDILYWNGSSWITLLPGMPGQSLLFENCNPTWIDNTQGITTNNATYTTGTTAFERKVLLLMMEVYR